MGSFFRGSGSWNRLLDVKLNSPSFRNAFLQYAMIYCSLVTGNSYLYSYYLVDFTGLFALALIGLAVFSPKFWRFRDVAFLSFVLVVSMLVRCYAGGSGIGTFLRYSMTVLCISTAIVIDVRMFLTRLVRIVCFLSIISVSAYFARLVIPGFYHALPLHEFESQGTYYSMSEASNVNYHTKGLFLLCVREGEYRNIGIFTEPGVYQGVLTATLLVVLFLSKRLTVSKRERTLSLIVLSLAIVTCGSTTGLLVTMVVVILYVLSAPFESFRSRGSIRFQVVILLFIGLAFLFADYVVRGDASILHESLFGKLTPEDFIEGNGAVRIDSLVASVELLFEQPFGVGFDVVQEYKGASAVGAGLFVTTAALGLPFLMGYLVWLLPPILRAPFGPGFKFAYLVLYFVFAFSQSLVLTPVLVAISIYCSVLKEDGKEFDGKGSVAV